MGPLLHDGLLDHVGGLAGGNVFPDPDDMPAVFLKRSIGLVISFHIAVYLFCPPFGVGLWERGVLGAFVPEAPVDEDGYTLS